MQDSLFTSKNHFDEGTLVMGKVNCTMLAESTARRLTKIAGPHAAAEEFYRIADICAAEEARALHNWQGEHAFLNPPARPQAAPQPEPHGMFADLPPVQRNPWFWMSAALATLAICRALFAF